jgi:DNA-binding transcriptional ArsR family regulator
MLGPFIVNKRLISQVVLAYSARLMTPRTCGPSHPIEFPADPDEELAILASALGHPARVRILRFLMTQPSCFAGAIVEHLPLAQSTVSQHLKVLRDAGLVRGEVDGLHICYCPDEARLVRITALLEDLGKPLIPSPATTPSAATGTGNP